MTIRATRAALLWVVLLITIGFAFFSYMFPNPKVLIVARSFTAATSFAVVIRYRWAFREVWRQGLAASDEALLTFAIVGMYLALGINAVWLWVWRGSLERQWMIDASFNGYLVLITAFMALLHIGAPGTFNGRLAREVKFYVIGIVVAGVILSVVGLLATETFQDISDMLEPFMAERPR
jgi:hypothetical protein